ncbi:ribonuclease D, exosome-associated factor Rrp6 [Tanacetum coccineum]
MAYILVSKNKQQLSTFERVDQSRFVDLCVYIFYLIHTVCVNEKQQQIHLRISTRSNGPAVPVHGSSSHGNSQRINFATKAKTMPSTIRELLCVLKYRHPLIDHHLGPVTNIIQEAKANATAFEEVAASLKRERLEMEQVARDASKTSEEASIKSKSMADLEKRKAADSGGAQDGSQERNKGVSVANVLPSFENGLETGGQSQVFSNSVRTHQQLQFLKQYQWNVQYVLKGCKEIDYMVLVLSDSLLEQGYFGYHLDEGLVSHKVGLLDPNKSLSQKSDHKLVAISMNIHCNMFLARCSVSKELSFDYYMLLA